MTEVDAGHRPRNAGTGRRCKSRRTRKRPRGEEGIVQNDVQTNPNPQDSGDDDDIAESGRSRESGRAGGRGGTELFIVSLGLFKTQQELGGH